LRPSRFYGAGNYCAASAAFFVFLATFSALPTWGNGTARLLASGRCQVIGIDGANLPLEYPLMALLREQQPQTSRPILNILPGK
jgi:hypothetical protein